MHNARLFVGMWFLIVSISCTVQVLRWGKSGGDCRQETMRYLPGGTLEGKVPHKIHPSKVVQGEWPLIKPCANEGSLHKDRETFATEETSPVHLGICDPLPHAVMESLLRKVALESAVEQEGHAREAPEKSPQDITEQSTATKKSTKRRKKIMDAIVDVIEQRTDLTVGSPRMPSVCNALFNTMSNSIGTFVNDPEIRGNQPEIVQESLQNVLVQTRTWIRQCAGIRNVLLSNEQVAHGADRTVQAMLCAIGQQHI